VLSLLQRVDIERDIETRAKDFDLIVLLRLLHSLGWERENIYFESNRDPVSSQSLIESVVFHRASPAHVSIVVNFGLLGANALVPSYFTDVIDESMDPERFYDFIRFFDHRLIETFIYASYPEDDTSLYQSWDRVKLFYFKIIGAGSVSTLQTIFQLYFPELRVVVTRAPFRSSTDIHALRMGSSKLDGTAVIGREYESDAAGFKVDIYADEEINDIGEAWPHVVRNRLQSTVLPLLAPFRLSMIVTLTVLAHSSWARIKAVGYLGYERIEDDEEGAHRIEIWRSGEEHIPR
jgi:hypothetical protein